MLASSARQIGWMRLCTAGAIAGIAVSLLTASDAFAKRCTYQARSQRGNGPVIARGSAIARHISTACRQARRRCNRQREIKQFFQGIHSPPCQRYQEGAPSTGEYREPPT